ncbi:unnamed protein product, partial [Effrenium voratum]
VPELAAGKREASEVSLTESEEEDSPEAAASLEDSPEAVAPPVPEESGVGSFEEARSRFAAGEAPCWDFEETGGDELVLAELDMVSLGKLQRIWLDPCVYWMEETSVVGVVKGARIEGSEVYLDLLVEGTRSGRLLEYVSGTPEGRIKLHVCPRECEQELCEDGLVHGRVFREVPGVPSEAWMSNACRVEPDENRALREEAEKLRNAGVAGALAPDENSYEPEAGDLEADQKKRKEAKEKRGKKKRNKVVLESKKALKDVVGSTGLDPDPVVRKIVLRRASRTVRKKRKRSDDSSGRGSSSSMSEEEPEELFGCSTRPEEVGRRFPGVLAAEGIREMRASLLKNTGQLWDLEDGPLPPLSTMYFRQTLMSRMAPPMARETHTLCYGLDLLLQGRAAELGDLLVQRIKSLEGVAAGLHYSVMQKMELLPMDASRVARYTEVHDAAKVARDEARALSAGSRAQGRGGSDSGWVPYGPRGRDEKGGGKGKGEKGKDKGRAKDWPKKKEEKK